MSRSRSNEEKRQDLELRLAPFSVWKGGALPSSLSGAPQVITIEDDDDDDDDDEVVICAPIYPRETRRFFPCPSSSMLEVVEDDLDLRLGVSACDGSSGYTNGGDKCAGKYCEASGRYFTLELKEVKLRCAICMDTMKEETSTLCGHIFCKPCIIDTILALNRCPTCRKELSISSIHRIFLPGAIC